MRPTLTMLFAFCLYLISYFPAAAQDFPRIEVYGGYAYVNGPQASSNRTSLNGWQGSATFNVNRWAGIAADFGGFYGSDRSVLEPPAVPCPPFCSGVGFSANSSVYTFLIGPRFYYRRDRLAPFAEFLLGGAHSGTTTHLIGTIPPGFPSSYTAGNSSFAFATGGGVDYRLSKHFAWRGEIDYLQTRFVSTHQNNVLVSTGLVFGF